MAEGVKADAKTEAEAPKKRKKLSKAIEGTVLTVTEAVTGKVLKYDFSTLPEAIQQAFGPFGMGHKIGDAAAGKKGQEAVDSMNKVWEGLQAGNWSVRAPAAKKITKKSIMAKFDEMPDGKEKVLAEGLLKKLGLMG